MLKIVPPKKRDSSADGLSKHRIRGWAAFSDEGLKGKGSRNMSVFSHRYHDCLVCLRCTLTLVCECSSVLRVHCLDVTSLLIELVVAV